MICPNCEVDMKFNVVEEFWICWRCEKIVNLVELERKEGSAFVGK